MKKKFKLKAIYFLLVAIFIFFTSTLNISSSKPPLVAQQTQENLILLHTNETIEDYISADIGDSNIDNLPIWKDFLPETLIPDEFFKEQLVFNKKVSYLKYKLEKYTILSRYKERILRI